MASIHCRNGKLHISYYRYNTHFRYSLKLPNTQSGRKKAIDIKNSINAQILNDKMKLLLFGIEEKTISLKLSEVKSEYYKAKGLPESNKGGYHSSIKWLTESIGDINIDDIRPAHFNIFKDNLKNKVSENTIASYLKHLRNIFNYLIKAELYNKANPVPFKKTELKEPIIIPDKDLEKIFNHLKLNDLDTYYIIKLLSLTGMRITECLSVTKSDFDFENNIMTVHNFKAKRTDKLPLYHDLKTFVIELLGHCENEKLFNTSRHKF